MELDDLKRNWNGINSALPERPYFDPEKLDKITFRTVRGSLKKIVLSELLGSLVCIGFAVFVGFNLYRLDAGIYRIAGIITMFLLVILPAVSFFSLRGLYSMGDFNRCYLDTLQEFTAQKLRFYRMQKLNIILCYLLSVLVIFLSTRLFGRHPITDSKSFFIVASSVSYILLTFFSGWVFRSYQKTIRSTEALLNDFSV